MNILHRVLKLKRNAVNKMRFKLFYDNSINRFFTPHSFKFGGGGMPRRRLAASQGPRRTSSSAST